jgi:hypothetical protein
MNKAISLVLLLSLSMIVACVTPTPESEMAPEEPTEEVPPVEPAPTEEPEVELPEEEPEPEEAVTEGELQGRPREEFEVTEEVYEQTFDEVEQTIARLNTIIRERNFQEWKSYLTKEYEEEYSDPETLAEWSESPLLQRNEITLRSLEDYFNFVVVPSRSNARLDDLEFVDENTVEAFMNVRGRRALLYLLRKEEGVWKIDTY